MLCRKSGASRCGNCIFAEVKRFVGMAAQIFLQRAFCKLVKRFAERVAPVAQTTQASQKSETLCRKGGTSRSDNAPLASGACEGAKLACGTTLSATREVAKFARLLNSCFRARNLLCQTIFRITHLGLCIYFAKNSFAFINHLFKT